MTIDQRLQLLRSELELSQSALAERIGVRQAQYSSWERGKKRVPSEHLPALARELRVDVRILEEVYVAPRPWGQRLPTVLAEHRWPVPVMPPYPIRGTMDDMLALGNTAQDVFWAVQKMIPAGELAQIAQYFPRDSAWELLASMHAVEQGLRLTRLTLAAIHCPILAVVDERSVRSGLWHVREAMQSERPDLLVIMFPQVWVVSPLQSEWYRLDFLCYVRRADGEERWADLEIQGSQHAEMIESDERRARGIGLPRLSFWAREVLHRDFGTRLITRLTRLLDQQPPIWTTQKRPTS